MTARIKLYRNPKSGHCHRVQVMISLLDIPHETVDLDMADGAHKAANFLKMSPLSQVSAIDDDGTILSDSNAILVYLSDTYSSPDWTGHTPAEKAEIQRWLSIAAGEIASGPAAARPSLANIAAYSYVAHAPEGGVSLADYPNVQNWLKIIAALPKCVGMAKSPIPA